MPSNDENVKNPKWKDPMDQSGVKPDDYNSNIDSANGSVNNNLPGSAIRSDQSGVKGFASNLGGHAKANHGNTSSFGLDLPITSPNGGNAETGQKNDREREPTTSIVARIGRNKN